MLPVHNPESSKPQRHAPCIGCGTAVPYRTNSKVLCASCKTERKLKRDRVIAERQRRKRGVAVVKGERASCSDCKTPIKRKNFRHTLCADCARTRNQERARTSSSLRGANDERRERYNEWLRLKRRSDPAFRVAANMRTLIHRALRSKKQGKSWRTFVPYSLADLMRHLERQFSKGMAWENYGATWEIDHILPRSSFDETKHEEFCAAWALTNLRPLLTPLNRRKHATRTHLL